MNKKSSDELPIESLACWIDGKLTFRYRLMDSVPEKHESVDTEWVRVINYSTENE